MDKVNVIYGSSTGNTESAAKRIAEAFGVEPISVANVAAANFQADLLILGSSTWGLGELQDDWAAGILLLGAADLSGKKVAVFGTGDQSGFPDTFCDAIGILADKAVKCGATLVGKTSASGYMHTGSRAETDGQFCGLVLDDNNESDKTPGRIVVWVEQLKQEIG